MLVGFVIAVGANPYDDPTVLGGAFKGFAASSSFGLALRSTARAVPLIALGVAVLIGIGVNALAAWAGTRRVPLLGVVIAALVIVLAIVNLPSLWQREIYGTNLDRAEDIPTYWTDAIAALDRAGPRHPGARDPGGRLRLVPLGQHGRPDHARAHGPSLCGA